MSLNCLSETVAEMCTGVTREGFSLSGLMSRLRSLHFFKSCRLTILTGEKTPDRVGRPRCLGQKEEDALREKCLRHAKHHTWRLHKPVGFCPLRFTVPNLFLFLL